MKKAFLAVMAGLAICAAGLTTYKVYDNYQKSKTFSSLMLENLELLSKDESRQDQCYALGLTEGLWNMALVCAETGINTVTCEIAGKLSFKGVTLEGSYKKGNKYELSWEHWKCEISTGNCCAKSEQGIRLS